MPNYSLSSLRLSAVTLTVASICTPAAQAAATLEGFALMPANTYAEGPVAGQFQNPANGITPPYPGQSVQGFSAVLNGPAAGTFLVMPDNGFGAKTNSADALLRMYGVTPDFRTADGGTGTVSAANFTTGAAMPGFTSGSYLTLHDPDHRIGFPIVASMANYPNGANTLPVDASIASGRLLTGSDFDVESVRRDRNGNLWFGEEFGPFLVKTDGAGKVLRSEIPLPNFTGAGSNALVQSPQYPGLLAGTNNLRGSNGFEGMAINAGGTKLYPLLEGPLIPDADQKRLIISEFDLGTEAYTGNTFAYKLDPKGTNIGDMTAINDNEYLVIERNGIQGTQPNAADMFKKIFKIDLSKVGADGFVEKTEVVDLLNIADPDDLNQDGKTTFDFPFVTIESVLILDPTTLLVINDNNYPGNGGRTTVGPDNTEFIRIRLDQQLAVPVPEPETYALMLGGLGLLGVVAKRRQAKSA